MNGSPDDRHYRDQEGSAHLEVHRATTGSERVAVGRATRKAVPRARHAEWASAPDRPDPVRLLEEQNATRVPWLVPIRHHAMRVSPFTFYRGTARIMAADLAATPTSGLDVQLGGDAHLSNFGAYASPERQLVFDQNDFDETLPGPWEWDVKRLAASFLIAARHLASRRPHAAVTRSAVTSYRTAMAQVRREGYLDLWYEQRDRDDVRQRRAASARRSEAARSASSSGPGRRPACRRWRSSPRTSTGGTGSAPSLRCCSRCATCRRSTTPTPFEARRSTASRRTSRRCPTTVMRLLDRYAPLDIAVKVVGVGSVGTRCLVCCSRAATTTTRCSCRSRRRAPRCSRSSSAPSAYDNHGQRVVEGQRLIQAQSDIFLGWTEGELEAPPLLRASAPRLEGLGRGRGRDARPAAGSTRSYAA